MFEFPLGYRESRANGGYLLFQPWNRKPNELQRKKRTRFSGTEKRVDMLLFLEPLIYTEGITNGLGVLWII
jgi:hypothetical protein